MENLCIAMPKKKEKMYQHWIYLLHAAQHKIANLVTCSKFCILLKIYDEKLYVNMSSSSKFIMCVEALLDDKYMHNKNEHLLFSLWTRTWTVSIYFETFCLRKLVFVMGFCCSSEYISQAFAAFLLKKSFYILFL